MKTLEEKIRDVVSRLSMEMDEADESRYTTIKRVDAFNSGMVNAYSVAIELIQDALGDL